MRANDRLLIQLYERTGGRTDRTLHAWLHVAKPLALSQNEMRRRLATLIDAGLIETDPGFDRLIRLTPAGAAACARVDTVTAVVHDPPRYVMDVSSLVLPPEMRAPLTAQTAHG